MDRNSIIQYKADFDAIGTYVVGDDGTERVEVWFARDLQTLLGYARWENFQTAINRAVDSCKSLNVHVDDHFREVTKMITLGKGGKRDVQDFMGEPSITREHIQNNVSVRGMLAERGIRPEELPPAEDIKKLERRVNSETKKIEKTTTKLPKK